MRTRLVALALAGATAVATASPAMADTHDDSSSEVSLSSGIGLISLGAIVGLFTAEGISSALNAPYCGANPDKCPNSLVASLSSAASSEIDRARAMIPRVPTAVTP